MACTCPLCRPVLREQRGEGPSGQRRPPPLAPIRLLIKRDSRHVRFFESLHSRQASASSRSCPRTALKFGTGDVLPVPILPGRILPARSRTLSILSNCDFLRGVFVIITLLPLPYWRRLLDRVQFYQRLGVARNRRILELVYWINLSVTVYKNTSYVF